MSKKPIILIGKSRFTAANVTLDEITWPEFIERTGGRTGVENVTNFGGEVNGLSDAG
ncbi:hypothetical protein [Burkholderia cepacia]|uniref:hypothetical protein n=1 Tax=Burkholderia cepacia TaxID=292 RepID=UPI0016511B0D|nr:hypothetical protein [Burkholderia cepacia]